ncbi:MAG: transcription-repair coupling factor [Armatimonadota bacterium]
MLYDIVNALAHSAPMAPLREGFARGARRQWVSGARGTGKSLLAAALIRARRDVEPAPNVHFILAPSQERAETLFADLTAIYGRDRADFPLALFPSLESLLYEETSPDFNLIRERISVLARLAAGEPLVVIATPDAALHRTLPPALLRASVRELRVNDEVDPSELAMWLAVRGYAREGMVEQPGQFGLRGGVLDIYPSTEAAPLRLEFFGDEIESIRPFDPGTQRSQGQREAVTLYPAREILLAPEHVEAAEPAIRAVLEAQLQVISREPIRLPGEDGKPEDLLSPADRLSSKIGNELELLGQGAYFNGVEYYLPYLHPEGATLLDYLPADAAVILDEPDHIAHAFHRFREGLEQLETSRLNRGALLPAAHPLYLPLTEGLTRLAERQEVAISLLPPGGGASFTDPVVKSVGDCPGQPEESDSGRLTSPFSPELGTVPGRKTEPFTGDSPYGHAHGLQGESGFGHTGPGQSPRLTDGACIELQSQAPTNYTVAHDQLRADLAEWLREGFTIVAVTHQEHRMAEMLVGMELPVLSGEAARPADDLPAGRVLVRRAELGEGIVLPGAKLALLTDGELLGWQKQRRTISRRQSQGQTLASINQLTPGEYVVHIHHGIGQYTGLVRRDVQGVEREFLQIDYAGADKLFVPVDQLDRVQKYLGLSEDPPEVHRLGSGDWERTKRRTKKSTEDLANQLLKLQAQRAKQQGHAFSVDTPWQREMEEGFPWMETTDQLRSIMEVKYDMEQPAPMDRLICGDVGYGKTEVALRAAFKAIMDGMQVAVLAPTTVLASQHFRTFRERLAAFPVRVELLSRSVPKREQTKIAADLADGAVDLIIGTHRLLSKDVNFKKLGLVIIDEEQRFGVKQKEKFKSLNPGVDIITMSATPIPRTLHMALSGLREMSLINTPPEGRMPVRTLALEADDEVLREAILRELDRDGQVFLLHNRIQSIYHVAEHVRQTVPQARVEVAHGQMEEGELDRIMTEFYARKFDVLVCTAIIENGLDVPNVNTIIVDQADTLGLAQMYQLRGRVGRSDRQAYAYLTWKPRKKLNETAKERIAAMKEFASLGSGYKVALRDLEIRGAGDLLGAEQSGVLAAVGYDLYCQMLEEAVRIVRGEEVPPSRDVQIDLPLDAFLPEDYVPELNQRIDLYRRLAAVREWKKAEEIRDEMLDRFGKPLPTPADNLFRLVAVKLLCLEIGITHILSERGAVVLRLPHERSLSPQAVKRLQAEAPEWRKRNLPAPTFTSERVTIYTMNVDQPTLLLILEQVADRLRNIETEVMKSPKPAFTPDRRRYDPRW